MSEFPASQLIASTTLPPQLVLPDISSYIGKVFGLKINPHHQEAELQSYAWFDSFGIHTGSKREKFFDSGFGLMTAMCYPDAELARLRLTMDLVLWLFAFDDMTDGGALDSIEGMKRAVDVTMKVLREPDYPPPNFKVAATIQDCFHRMRQDATPTMLRRFVDSLDYYTQACFQQKVHRSTDSIPTVEEYIQLRRDTSAMKIAFAVLEYTLGLDLPEEVANHPLVTELAIAGNDILTWANDIYSFPIEFARGDTHNLVCVAMHHNHLDLEGAIDFVNQLTRKRLDEYVETKAKLPSFGPDLDDQVAQYILGIEYCVQGFIDWTFMTPRYFGSEATKVKETGIVNIISPITLDAPMVVEA
ncbi:hypothetical protein OPQ81_008161 [Rhizoctonia solani]|nr:hypothetical protein OPQ81_008161 [Rhizoctonia solani]